MAGKRHETRDTRVILILVSDAYGNQWVITKSVFTTLLHMIPTH